MSTKLELELETFAGTTIQAYKDAAREAGLVLQAADEGQDSGDFPQRPYFQLRRFRRAMAISKGEPKKVITSMHRQVVNTRDEKGKPIKKEYLTWLGYYEIKDHRDGLYHANIEAGKYEKPKIVPNGNLTYNPKTGEPIGPEKILSGSEIIYTIEVPKSKTERKKLIDEIIGDNFKEDIKYYFKSHDELARRDPTFSYDDFVNCSIEELKKVVLPGWRF